MLGLLISGCAAATTTTPVWPDVFTQNFTEVESYGKVYVAKTSGQFLYDWPNRRYKVIREKGEGDRYCGTVEKFKNTPCNHLVTGGKRYLDFPKEKYCCFCCDDSHGCGVLDPAWMKTAVENGTEKINGTEYRKWDIKGLQDNFYYETMDEARVMRKLDQGSDDFMDFSVASRKTTVDPKQFELPGYCNQTCGLTTICAGLRARAAQ
jgi:hypothetical protein